LTGCDAGRVTSVLAPLRSRPFRYLVIGSTVSRLGNAIAPVAPAFAVLDLTGSATSLGIVVGARSLANVIFLLLGGVVADRLPRSFILVGSSLASAATQGVVAVLVFARTDSVALLAVLSAVNGTLSAFALPASVALVPQTVPADQLVPANAFARMGANAASLLGVAVAGIVVAGLGSAWGIAIDAASFAVAALFFGSTPRPATVGEVAAGPVSHAIGVRPTLVACGLVIVAAIVAMISNPSVRNLVETESGVPVAAVAR
jgi:MFS family permease